MNPQSEQRLANIAFMIWDDIEFQLDTDGCPTSDDSDILRMLKDYLVFVPPSDSLYDQMKMKIIGDNWELFTIENLEAFVNHLKNNRK